MSLADCEVHAALPVSDLEQARKFYGEVVGLKAGFESPSGIFFHSGGGSRILVFTSRGASTGAFTQAAWEVADMEAEVAGLRAKGIVFEEYDFPSLKTVDGVASVPVGKAAWFKDPDGNMLGLVELDASA